MKRLLAFLGITLVLGIGPATQAWQEARLEAVQSKAISASEFSHLIQTFSEEDGLFRSDNFVSNETSYLHVLGRLEELGAIGGAYLGVGPEQNFTYIAKIRPRIAFIVDIRRQAVVQHLMFKAIFELADTRVEFFSRLFSKPLGEYEEIPGLDSTANELLEYFDTIPGSLDSFADNLSILRKTIQERFQFPLSGSDDSALVYVYRAFHKENLNIHYRSDSRSWGGSRWGYFPTLRELILEPGVEGELGNFLTDENDYRFVRDMQRSNRIIPIVGNFAGSKALPSVASYLKKNGYTVTAFYTSNVEQYLFRNGVFNNFAENIKELPVNDNSLFIRAFPNTRAPHPGTIRGHRLTTLLQKIPVFLKDYGAGLYTDYSSLVRTNFISARIP